jgi:hypothetical protein
MSQSPKSTQAARMPTFALISRATSRNARASAVSGYTAPLAGVYAGNPATVVTASVAASAGPDNTPASAAGPP